jgi:hypothetical protein
MKLINYLIQYYQLSLHSPVKPTEYISTILATVGIEGAKLETKMSWTEERKLQLPRRMRHVPSYNIETAGSCNLRLPSPQSN